MSHDDLINLLDYHYWARDRMLDALDPLPAEQFTRDMNNSLKSVRDTAAHIFAAEMVWYSRWCGESPKGLVSADKFPDVASLRSAWNQLERDVRAFVDKLGPEGINRRFDYAMLDGRPASSVFSHMLSASSEPRQLSPRPGHDHAAPERSGASEEYGLITFYRELERQQARTA